ncbi:MULTISPECIES: exodeoxyribonuclease VII small subunit [Porphyromonas]|uniref:Exodeoxyribonuclease VII small subunit n=1 Tax=Porphyromonas circumdentaria TaxID=29524 RepID=A0A1T4L8A2_9PORP|nr:MULTISPECIES: exodeoxyribonuclease VII small subunit [Porphyromonas]MBB6275362.1 exodeoxyribonuclease VII small subunit [Porphyromonas circumdentaria]MDO4721855.1 exodeoxyribonuclease VII small subunit [Porphyromonas circumdentaria]SJZ50946.1 Exodeoxyribonuclease VII small subunit [Porphyromonas circumdentaria]
MENEKKTQIENYSQAIARLTAILNTIEHDSPDVDDLMILTDEAVELITFCREKLKTTDKQIEALLAKLSNEEPAAETSEQ